MRRRTSRRLVWAGLLVLMLALVLPPFINVNRYRARAAESISRALGRSVAVSNIELKLLPRPGLVLYNFVVADDPAFGAEPMLRADSVTAYLRLTSLWRGRLEIGTLDLDNPSLNLVRRSDGHWNVEELLERTSEVRPAPTTELRPETRPRFPYVEASSGRINFKLGEVKKAFAFTDADFALWLESENLWGIRLEARPIRTDVNINDTGTLEVEGRFQRASNLRDTPVYLRVNFRDSPLGQLTKLFYGRDRGWRGKVHLSSVMTGTPANLAVTLDAQVDDFRRYDIFSGEVLRLRTHCTGTYASRDDALQNFACESPIGAGIIRVRGDVRNWGAGGYALGLGGEHIPAERMVVFARHAKKDLPADLTATGEVNGVFTVRESLGQAPQWSGGGQTTDLGLRAIVLKQDLELGQVEFGIPQNQPKPAKRRGAKPHAVTPTPPSSFELVVKPFAVPLGAASPATASGEFDRLGYQLHLSGGAELGRLLNVAQAVGIGTPGVGLAGEAQLDLDVNGNWTGFAQPVPSGKLQVKTVTAELQGVSEPLLVNSAAAVLQSQLVKLTAFSAGFAKGGQLSGTASFPVHCTGPENCLLQFDVRAEDVTLARLDQLLNPAFSRQPWYHLLAIGRRHNDALIKLRAQGRFVIPKLELGPMTATNVNGSLELSAGKLRIPELRADFLGGHEDGSWLGDFVTSPPRFMGNGVVTRLAMSQLASVMHDNWAAGSVGADFSLVLAGMTPADLLKNASGTADFTWNNGVLRHVSLDSRGTPVAFSIFSGKVALQDGTFTVSDGKMQSSGASYKVQGSASYDRSLKVTLERSGGQSYVVSGTLDKPHVETVPITAAEAALR